MICFDIKFCLNRKHYRHLIGKSLSFFTWYELIFAAKTKLIKNEGSFCIDLEFKFSSFLSSKKLTIWILTLRLYSLFLNFEDGWVCSVAIMCTLMKLFFLFAGELFITKVVWWEFSSNCRCWQRQRPLPRVIVYFQWSTNDWGQHTYMRMLWLFSLWCFF